MSTKIDCERKRKGQERTFSGIIHDALYRLPHHLPFKMAAEQSRTAMIKCALQQPKKTKNEKIYKQVKRFMIKIYKRVKG